MNLFGLFEFLGQTKTNALKNQYFFKFYKKRDFNLSILHKVQHYSIFMSDKKKTTANQRLRY